MLVEMASLPQNGPELSSKMGEIKIHNFEDGKKLTRIEAVRHHEVLPLHDFRPISDYPSLIASGSAHRKCMKGALPGVVWSREQLLPHVTLERIAVLLHAQYDHTPHRSRSQRLASFIRTGLSLPFCDPSCIQ